MHTFIATQERRIYRAEVRLIGRLLRSPRRLSRLAARIKPCNFSDYRHQLIWSAMIRLNERGDQVSIESVLTELTNQALDEDAGGLDYLNYLSRRQSMPTKTPA